MGMKTKAALTAFGLAGLSMANSCNNNCGRQVIGTARASPALTDRQSMCSAYVTSTTTTTVTPAAVTSTSALIYNRNVHGPRQVTPSLTGTVPAYATDCADVTAYWEACQCFSGITPTLVTVTATAATPTTTISGPTCTRGVEFGLYIMNRANPAASNIYPDDVANPSDIDVQGMLSDASLAATGVTAAIGLPAGSNWQQPIQIYGASGPANSDEEYNAVDHRGFLVPNQQGTYLLTVPYTDDIQLAWVGNTALGSTGWTVNNAQLVSTLDYQYQTYQINVDATQVGSYIPFRIFWANGPGPAGFLANIQDPSGACILGEYSVKNDQIIASCSGNGAPAGSSWGAWP